MFSKLLLIFSKPLSPCRKCWAKLTEVKVSHEVFLQVLCKFNRINTPSPSKPIGFFNILQTIGLSEALKVFILITTGDALSACLHYFRLVRFENLHSRKTYKTDDSIIWNGFWFAFLFAVNNNIIRFKKKTPFSLVWF